MATCTMNASWTHATFYVSASASGRTGNVSVTLYLWNTGGQASWTSNSISDNFYITINGTTTYFTINRVNSATEGTTKVVKSASKSFTLNQDGSGSVSVSVGGNIPGTSFKITGNNTYSTSIKGDPVTYSVSYNANGGSGAPGTQYYYYGGSNIYLSSTKPTKSGYNFLGWSLSSTATSPSYSSGQAWSSYNANNYTLYAVWELANGKSTFSLSSNIINLDTSTITISLSLATSSNTHTITLTIAGSTYTLATGVGSSHSFTLPASSYAKLFTNSKSTTGTITATTYASGSSLGSYSESVIIILPESLGKPDKPSAVIVNEREFDAIIKLTKPAFKYSATFAKWDISTTAGVFNITGDRIDTAIQPEINKNAVLKIRAIDSRGYASDPVFVVWHSYKSGPCIFLNGKWVPCVPYLYKNGEYVECKETVYNDYIWYYKDEKIELEDRYLLSSDGSNLVSSDGYILLGKKG